MASLKSTLLLLGLVTYAVVLHYQLSVLWPAEDTVSLSHSAFLFDARQYSLQHSLQSRCMCSLFRCIFFFFLLLSLSSFSSFCVISPLRIHS